MLCASLISISVLLIICIICFYIAVKARKHKRADTISSIKNEESYNTKNNANKNISNKNQITQEPTSCNKKQKDESNRITHIYQNKNGFNVQRKNDEIYKLKIIHADNLFKNNVNYEFTEKAYEDALKFNPNDKHALSQINILKAKQQKKNNKTTHTTTHSRDVLIIERSTNYSNYFSLNNNRFTFDAIQQYSKGIIMNINEQQKNQLHNRLCNGIEIIDDEQLMHMYLFSYGKMHKAKLISAFDAFFSSISIRLSVEIIDWGCGQGLAVLVLLDYLKDNSVPLSISKITLIEPSIICLKRAALNISIAKNNVHIKTICSKFNDLKAEQLYTKINSIKLHLFSNVLDIDESIFSQENLIRKIEKTQKGINYFICVSPYITDEKKDRIDSFKRHFHANHDSVEFLFETSNSGRLDDDYWNCNNNYTGKQGVFCTHPECGCENKWTRVIKVFKVEL